MNLLPSLSGEDVQFVPLLAPRWHKINLAVNLTSDIDFSEIPTERKTCLNPLKLHFSSKRLTQLCQRDNLSGESDIPGIVAYVTVPSG